MVTGEGVRDNTGLHCSFLSVLDGELPMRLFQYSSLGPAQSFFYSVCLILFPPKHLFFQHRICSQNVFSFLPSCVKESLWFWLNGKHRLSSIPHFVA